MKIISKRCEGDELKVALDIQSWVPYAMVFNHEKGQWEYEPDIKEFGSIEKIHFKFIDRDGSWFTDNDFPKEFDSDGNENNVVYAEAERLSFKDYVLEEQKSGPNSPFNTPKDNCEEAAVLKEDVDGTESKGEEGDDVEKDKSIIKATKAGTLNGDLNNEELQDSRPSSGVTILTQQGEHSAEYTSLLNRVVEFLKKMFRRWFSFGNREIQ